jgi:peptide/nickel transport system substrate-binding protein
MRPSKWVRYLQVLVIASVVALVAAGCTSTKKTPAAEVAQGKKGGRIVIAAGRWPECLNPITSCAQASWLPWTTWYYTMPRLMEVDPKGNYVASDLLAEAPTEQNGGLKMTPFTVTYKLRPEAVWDDSSPITSEDVKYTWQAIMKTTGTLSTTGYDQIDTIDTPDAHTAVIRFKSPYAAWADLFGSTSINGLVLKKAAFNGKVDLKGEMKDGYSFSGGPWKLKVWSKQQAVLVRNDNYWVKNKIPLLDQVTFVPRSGQSSELNAIATGEAQAAYPQPSRGITKRLTQPGLKFATGGGAAAEGLWMNHSKFPFNDPKVREAFAYAVDRQAVVDTIYKADFPDLQVLNCAGWVSNVGDWCDNTDFADLTYQPDKAKQILRQDGWQQGSDGIFAKGGKRLSITFSTIEGNRDREDTQALLQEKAKAAGIELVIKNMAATVLFEDRLPHLNYELVEYAQAASPDPSVTGFLACDQIPSQKNDFSGQNTIAWCNQEATRLMKDSDKTIDHAQRRGLLRQVGKLERQDLAWIPMFQRPLMLVWHADRLIGPIGDYAATSYSGFFNMYDWSVR